MKHGMQGVGVYWCIVEMLYEEGGYLPLEYERISFELRIGIEIIQSIIKEFELFKFDENRFWSESVLSRLQERCDKSEKARHSINKRWNKLGKHTNVIRPNINRNTKKDSIVENSKEKKENYTADFLAFYNLYPNKKEQPEAFKRWKKLNGKRPSLEIILDAIKKQKEWRDNAGEEWRPEWKNPATWLNKGCWADEVATETEDRKAWAISRQKELEAEESGTE